MNGLQTDLDAIFSKPLRQGGPGLAAGIYKHGRILYQRAYGCANMATGEPNSTRTLFNVGSTSKQFTAFAVYLLQERGLLSVHDGMRKHFPEMPRLYKDITIQQLIQHRSGLRCVNSLTFLEAWMDPKRPGTRDWNRMLPRQKELNFKPGSDWSYCNSGYGLMAELIQRKTGRSFKDFCASEIFAPLGMSRTCVVDDHSAMPRGRATGHFDSPRETKIYQMTPACPGPTDVWSNVEEMALWDAYLRSKSPLHARARRAMFASAPCGPDSRYGGGLFLFKGEGRKMFGHGGYDLGFRTDYRHDLKSGLAVFCVVNQEAVDPAALAAEAMRHLLKIKISQPPKAAKAKSRPKPGKAPGKSPWQRFSGMWRVDSDASLWTLVPNSKGLQVRIFGWQFDIAEKGGKLLGQGPAKDSVFKFLEKPGEAPVFFEFKKGKVFKRLRFLGKPSSKIKESRDYLGYYRSPETGVQRALAMQGGRMRVFFPFGPGSPLKFIRKDELLTEIGASLHFERGRDGRVLAMTVVVPGGRTRRLRLLKAAPGKRLFPIRGPELLDQSLEKRMVAFFRRGI